MKTWRFPATLTILTLLLLLHSGSVFAQVRPPLPAASEMSDPIISWTNRVRMQQGKAPLRVDDQLTRAAVLHARNMAFQDNMSHTLDGETLADRVRKSGYRYLGVGENVAFAAGQASPAWVMFDGWMRSEGHYKNIMNDEFTEIGVGVARGEGGKYFACQVFGRPSTAPVHPAAQSPFAGLTPFYVSPAPPAWAPIWQNWQRPQHQMMPYSPYTQTPIWRTQSNRRPVEQKNEFEWFLPWE